MLSRLAQQFADEIANHDWSDAPWRADGAGHQRDRDSRLVTEQLDSEQTERVRINVMWVAAQVLKFNDPNLDLHEFAAACGVPRYFTHNTDGRRSGTITAGVRMDGSQALEPGQSWQDLMAAR
ncbi:hypothetical protein [Phytoactinopolyspora limicola]|uniref:hypothetical protein n=1 Tax=Phytoactinopolyspora limicola TaxID=2715536 RepID=UPI001409D45E|nr:hypothetical protein [Phytoactinopolyspora limicola]